MNQASEPDRLPPPVPAPGYGPVLLKDRPIVGISACCAAVWTGTPEWERAAAAEGLLFGASPVLYLGRRRISPEAPEPDPTPSDIPLPETGGSDDA